MIEEVLVAQGVLGERPLRHVPEGQAFDVVLLLGPRERADDAIDGVEVTGREVEAPHDVQRGRRLVESHLLDRRRLICDVSLDHHLAGGHALGEALQQRLPIGEPRIGDRANEHDLILGRHWEHLRDQRRGEVPAERAGKQGLVQRAADRVEAARGADDRAERMGRDLDVDPLQHGLVAVLLPHVANRDRGHDSPLPSVQANDHFTRRRSRKSMTNASTVIQAT